MVTAPSAVYQARKPRVRFYTMPPGYHRQVHKVVYQPSDHPWTLKPEYGTYNQRHLARKTQHTKMMESKRSEAVLKNLAEELLTNEECRHFKQALQHFRVSNSVTTLCQQLKSVINTTPKILLLVELSNRMPRGLQEDFHRLCSLQFPNYDTYLKIFTNGNNDNEMPRVIAQDASGKIKIVSRGSEKKMMVKYNTQKQTYELRSIPGTSVTSGVYSNGSDTDNDDVFDDDIDNAKDNQGRATPVHLEGKKNAHKVFLNRHEDGSLGLGITGGKEYGCEIEINVVEEGGPAATQGLKIGDKILEVNGHNFHNITHAEAVMIMRNAWNLIILVERPYETMPTDEDVADMVSRQHEIQDLDIAVFPANSGKLGCVSQRLPSQDLIVKSVEENSPAFKGGVYAHDLIYKIDGISVRELSESQIIMLTNAKRISLSIKRYVPFSFEDTVDGVSRPVIENRARSAPPVKHQNTTYRSLSSPRSDGSRDHSPESPSIHHSTLYYASENTRPTSANTAHMIRQTRDKPEHLVYGNKPVREANWIITPKPREHRYTQRKDMYRDTNSHSYPIHVRSKSEDPFHKHYVSAGRETFVNGRVSRYVRNRSHSPHRNTITRVHNQDNVIRAIQMGLEKRHRAIRRSHYQMADPADYEWEI